MNWFIARRMMAALLVLIGSASIAKAASAQAPRHVTVALVEQLSDSAAATVVRSAGANGATVVMLRARVADATTLGAAMRALARSRALHGDTLRSRLIIKLYRQAPGGTLMPNERLVANDYFARLRRAPVRQFDGVGPARQVEIPMSIIPTVWAAHTGGAQGR